VQFQPKISNIEKVLENSVPEEIDDYESYIQDISKRVRNTNRFPYFALKFIDTNQLFKQFRFQVSLGKLKLAEYDKPFNGATEKRTIIENVNAFGRLQELRDENQLLAQINPANQAYDFEQFAPHYHIENNKIGLQIGNKIKNNLASLDIKQDSRKNVNVNLKQPIVDVFLSIHELPKMILLEYLEQGKAEKKIMDFVQLNSEKIFNKSFIEQIKSELNIKEPFQKYAQAKRNKIHAYYVSKGKKKVEDRERINDLKDRKKRLNALLEKHHLNDKQIPTRILDYWLNINEVKQADTFSNQIKVFKRDCMDRLKKLKKWNEKGEGSIPKIGEMATYLAKDIVNLIIDEGKKAKITSFYYDKLQECLALYADPEMKKSFIHICRFELGLYDKGGHPFLGQIRFEDFRYTQDIYKVYLQEKGLKMIRCKNKNGKYVETDCSWLRETFYKDEYNEKVRKKLTVIRMPDVKSAIPLSIRRMEKEQNSFSDWFHNIKVGKQASEQKKPIDLPTNLFDDCLIVLLKDLLMRANVPLPEKYNYSILLKLWWEHCRQDGLQKFYSEERYYEMLSVPIQFKIDSQAKFSRYYDGKIDLILKNKMQNRAIGLPLINRNDVEKSIARKIGNNEKSIRMTQEEDRLMLLMFERLLGNDCLNLKLKNIEEIHSETILSTATISDLLSFDQDGAIIKDKTQRQEVHKTITEERKRKDFSILKKYHHDRRLPELFEYIDGDVITVAQLKPELDIYNKAKQVVTEAVFLLEKCIFNKDKEGVLLLHQEQEKVSSHVQHHIYLNWLHKHALINEAEFIFLKMVRNTFAHNQFPQKRTMDTLILQWSDKLFAEQIATFYQAKLAALCTIISELKLEKNI
jgi:hypothetical protein